MNYTGTTPAHHPTTAQFNLASQIRNRTVARPARERFSSGEKFNLEIIFNLHKRELCLYLCVCVAGGANSECGARSRN